MQMASLARALRPARVAPYGQDLYGYDPYWNMGNVFTVIKLPFLENWPRALTSQMQLDLTHLCEGVNDMGIVLHTWKVPMAAARMFLRDSLIH